jgi:hypothetical protein
MNQTTPYKVARPSCNEARDKIKYTGPQTTKAVIRRGLYDESVLKS